MTTYYLQDSRSYVGNDVLWWAKDGKGYTSDLSKAHIYTQDDAMAKNRCRPSDIPWPCNYINEKTRPAVDMQYIKHSEAIIGLNITLAPPEKKERDKPLNCGGCGRFISERAKYYEHCQTCGTDNRP
jgi:hypothetical protein